MKYKDWELKAKKLKSGWKVVAVKKTKYGTQTMAQKAPYSVTRKEAIKGTKDMIRYYEKVI